MKYAIKHQTEGYVSGLPFANWTETLAEAWLFDTEQEARDHKYGDEMVVKVYNGHEVAESVTICPSLDHLAWEWVRKFSRHHSPVTLNSTLSSLTAKFAEARDELLLEGFKAGWKAGVEWYQNEKESDNGR